jgi:hypothetical protein
LRPNGKLVYSTCSIDPCENEAVVAEILRQCPWLELNEIDESLVEGLVMKPGLRQWNILDETGDKVELGDDLPRLPNLKIKHLCYEDKAKYDLEFDDKLESKISQDLVHCRRLYHTDNNTGGFFVAIFRHKPESTPEGIAKAYIPKRKPIEGSTWKPKLMERPRPNRHSVFLADEETVNQISKGYQIDANKWSWWSRGKRLNIAPKSVINRLYNRVCPNKRGDLWPEGTFHPLKLIHVGMPTFVQNKGTWRTRQEAIPALEYDLGKTCIEVDKEIAIKMLDGWVPTVEEFQEILNIENLNEGPLLLTCHVGGSDSLISAWAGVRVSLMINTLERDILRAKLGIDFESKNGE